jgi:hypothetical protein
VYVCKTVTVSKLGEGVEAAAGRYVFGSVAIIVSITVISAVVSAVDVTVRTTVVGVGASVNTIVESRVVTSTFVVGGNVDAGSVTVVAAAVPEEPPSTGTTE